MTGDNGELDLQMTPVGIATARDASESIYAFASKHGLIGASDGLPTDHDGGQDDDPAPPATKFESHSVIQTFRNRPIKLIVYDNKNRTVTVFTDKPIGIRLKKNLPHNINGNIGIRYASSGNPEVRGSDSYQFGAEPYYVHNGRYTCGSSIFPANRMGAGTFGALVRHTDGRLLGLSNNHVTGACNNSEPGLPILAPAPGDVQAGRLDPFTVGRHSTLCPIHDGHPTMIDITVNLDVALFEIVNENLVTSMQGKFFDTPASVLPLEPGMRVEKVGRTTGHTFGNVTGVSIAPVAVAYDVKEYGINKHVYFSGDTVFTVEADGESFFSAGGDSGSLVVYKDDAGVRHAVGLVFAGNERNRVSFIMPIDKVLEQINCSLISGFGAL